MFETAPTFALLSASLFLGLKHGFDYDHVAAIMDITSSQTSVQRGVLLSFLYGIGHGSVVALIGMAGLLLGVAVPREFLGVMEKVVGFTLILLGAYVLYSLQKYKGSDFRLLPRWALLINAVLYACDWARAKLAKREMKHRGVLKNGYGNTAACTIGGIHALGAETPTQMLLFVFAATAGLADKTAFGAAMIGIFSLGVILNNSLLGVLATYGYRKSLDRDRIYRAAALFTALFSVLLGAAFISGSIPELPKLE